MLQRIADNIVRAIWRSKTYEEAKANFQLGMLLNRICIKFNIYLK